MARTPATSTVRVALDVVEAIDTLFSHGMTTDEVDQLGVVLNGVRELQSYQVEDLVGFLSRRSATRRRLPVPSVGHPMGRHVRGPYGGGTPEDPPDQPPVPLYHPDEDDPDADNDKAARHQRAVDELAARVNEGKADDQAASS